MIEGLSHITLITRDLDRMSAIIETIFEGRERIAAMGLQARESRPRIEGEGHSLYFYDDDNHLFELHTGTLQERLRRYEQGSLRDAR